MFSRDNAKHYDDFLKLKAALIATLLNFYFLYEWGDKDYDELSEYEQDRAISYGQMLNYLFAEPYGDEDTRVDPKLRKKIKELIKPIVPELAENNIHQGDLKRMVVTTLLMQKDICTTKFGAEYEHSDEGKRVTELLGKYATSQSKTTWTKFKFMVSSAVNAFEAEKILQADRAKKQQ